VPRALQVPFAWRNLDGKYPHDHARQAESAEVRAVFLIELNHAERQEIEFSNGSATGGAEGRASSAGLRPGRGSRSRGTAERWGSCGYCEGGDCDERSSVEPSIEPSIAASIKQTAPAILQTNHSPGRHARGVRQPGLAR
jgi:hypothetical protein